MILFLEVFPDGFLLLGLSLAYKKKNPRVLNGFYTVAGREEIPGK